MPRRYSRRSILNLCTGGVVAGIAAPMIVPSEICAQNRTLYVNSWGGDLEQAWKKAYYEPFTKRTGISVKSVSPVNLATLRAQVQAKAFEWDLTCMNGTELSQAESEGLIEKIDFSIVKNIPESIIRGNGIGAYHVGTALVFRKDRFPKGGPQSWADFWDVAQFPGERCLFNRPFTCLAWALLAAGVPRDKLYPMDLDRAFKQMDVIKPHIKVWWTHGAQSQQLIRDGEVSAIGMYTARAAALIEQGAPLEIVWNGAENFITYWFVPRGTPKADIAWQFADFAAQPEQQAALSRLVPYGPTNPAALEFVPESKLRLQPSWPRNLSVSFQHDADWLGSRLAAIRERWTQWLAT